MPTLPTAWLSHESDGAAPSWLAAVAVGLAFLAAAKLGVATGLPPGNIVVVWPPNAILLAALLSVRPGSWWIYLLVTLAAEIVADMPTYGFGAALGYGVANFFEVSLAAALMRRFGMTGVALRTVRDFAVFLLSGPIVASAAAALIGAALQKAASPEVPYLHLWRIYWFSDATGLLIVGAILLVWRDLRGWRDFLRPLRMLEASLLTAGLGVTAWYVFSSVAPPGSFAPRVYLLFPFLLWSAARFGPRGASATLIVVTAVAITTAVLGLGPFAAYSNLANVTSLQMVLSVATVSILTIAFAVEQLQRSERALQLSNEELDRKVAERTRELRDALARNEILMREIHHRVKNNLQLIGNVLSLYGRSMGDPVAREKFTDAEAQIHAVAVLHEQLYKTDSVEAVEFCALLRKLCDQIARGAGPYVKLSAEADIIARISTDRALVLSIVVNELITNSIKYGTKDGPVAVEVRARVNGDRLVIAIADSGPGFPEDIDLDKLTGFGMRMTRAIIEHAGGLITRVPAQRGAMLEISVPFEDGAGGCAHGAQAAIA